MEKVHVLVAILLFDTIMHKNLNPMEFWRSRSLEDLGQRSHVSCLSTVLKGLLF